MVGEFRSTESKIIVLFKLSYIGEHQTGTQLYEYLHENHWNGAWGWDSKMNDNYEGMKYLSKYPDT